MPVSFGPLILLQTSLRSIHLPLTERASSSYLLTSNTCLPLALFITIGPSGLSRAMKRNVPEDIEDKNKLERIMKIAAIIKKICCEQFKNKSLETRFLELVSHSIAWGLPCMSHAQ